MNSKQVKLGEIAVAHYGKALKKESRKESGGVVVYGSAGEVGCHDEALFKLPTIVIGRKGSVGKVIWAPEGGWVIDTAYYIEVLDPSIVNLRYLYYFLDSANLAEKTITTSIPGLNRDDLYNVEVFLPSLKEQKRISEILDKAYEIRSKRQRVVALNEELLCSIFSDMFGDPIVNPKGWEVKTLGALSVKIHSGSTPKGGSKVYVSEGVSFLRSQNVWKNDIRLDDIVYIDHSTHEKMNKSSLKHKDILMTKTGRFNTENSSLGRAALFLGEDDSANINGHVYLIRLKEGALHEFILFILTSREYREYIRNVCVGGIDKRQINKEHLEAFPILCPPLELQKEFLTLYRAIRNNAQNFKEFVEFPLFESLAQKAFSGDL